MGPEEEEMGEGDEVEMVAEVDASVMSMSAEISDADKVAAAVDVDGLEIRAVTAAVTVSAAVTTEEQRE